VPQGCNAPSLIYSSDWKKSQQTRMSKKKKGKKESYPHFC